jgi:hypothetical protein
MQQLPADAGQVSEYKMTQQIIDIGIQGNDGTGDSIRESFRKVNENFTTLYAAFGLGGKIGLTDLADGPATYGNSQVIMSSTNGASLTARTLLSVSPNLTIDTTDNTKIIFSTGESLISNDQKPTLTASMNAGQQIIANLPDPSTWATKLVEFNSLYNINPPVTIGSMATSVKYVQDNFVGLTTTTVNNQTYRQVTDVLRVRDEPATPQTSDPDYDSTLYGNYVGTEAIQRKHAIRRDGDKMTGPLVLNDNPYPLAGIGPTDSTNRQAATKYYVDNQVFSSGINLYVSTTTGDDLQLNSPSGKEGRYWQYAYKTIGAAALAAEALENVAQTEPGPYRQRISYNSAGADEYFSTIQSVTATGGNTATPGYPDAYNLLLRNVNFLQNETIAYINNKYVNTFSFDTNTYQTYLTSIINAVGEDLVLKSSFNTTTAATALLAQTNKNNLAQVIDAVTYTLNQVNGWSFTSEEQAALVSYLDTLIEGLCYDLIYLSNFQSTQVALSYSSSNINLNAEEFATASYSVLAVLKAEILAIPAVSASPTATTSITDNIDLIINVISGGSVSTPTFPEVTGLTTTGKVSAKTLLLNNILFMQDEVTAFLAANYPGLVYSKATCKRDIEYIVWSVIYDFMYGGNTKSIFAAQKYWQGTQYSVTATDGATDRITISSTSSFALNDPVVFTGTTFGGIVAGKTYYIKSIVDGYTFIIADTSNGTIVNLSSATGTMAAHNRNIAASELNATLAAYDYLNTLAVNIVQNISVQPTYQFSVIQYQNITLTGGSTTISSINQNFGYIQSIIEYYTTVAAVTPTISEVTVTATATQIGTNYITVNDNSVLSAGQPITFTGTSFGGIVANYTYYILSIGSANRIKVTANQGSSTEATLSSDSGSMTGTVGHLEGVRSAILSEKTTLSAGSVSYILGSGAQYFPTITDGNDLTTVQNLFQTAIDLLSFGSAYRSTPTYDLTLAGLTAGNVTAVDIMIANFDFLVDAATNYILNANGAYTFYDDQTTYVNYLRYSLEAATYDSVYGGNTASIAIGAKWYALAGSESIDVMTQNVIGQLGTWAISTAKKIAISAPAGTTLTQYNPGGSNTLGSTLESTISNNYITVLGTAENGTYTSVVTPDPAGTTQQQGVRAELISNAATLSTDTINYLAVTYTGGFNYNESLCFRDVGLIVTAAAIDIYTNGNGQSVQAGKSYYRSASALLAITSQAKETIDAIEFTRDLAIQVLNQTTGSRYQSLASQVTDNGLSASAAAIADFTSAMNIILSIIKNGISAAPTPTYGSAVWTISINNGGQGYADQGYPGTYTPSTGTYNGGNNHILPGKILVGTTSSSYGIITNYTPGVVSALTGGNTSLDILQVKLTKPYLFQVGEQLEFGETVQALNIVIFVEAGIYYEDYPIRIPPNVSVRGDEFRRTIVRPIDRISQSPWRTTFFYRDAVIDGMQIGKINEGTDNAPQTNITLSGTSGSITATLASGVAPSSYIGKIIQDNYVVSTTATATNLDNTINVASNLGLNTGKTVVFSGTTFGGIVAGKTYYIIKVSNTSLTSNITISETVNGDALALSAATGTMTLRVPNPGKAIINTVSNNVMNCTVIYPFNSTEITSPLYSLTITGITNPSGTTAIVTFATQANIPFSVNQTITIADVNPTGYNGTYIVTECTVTSVKFSTTTTTAYIAGGTVGNWHLYDSINYGHHYLTNPLDISSTAKNNRNIDVFLTNDQNRVSNMTFQGHGGFAMVLDPTGQIKTKSPYGQVCTSFSQSINAQTFAGGQFVDGFAGRLNGTITAISYNAITGFNTGSLAGGSGYTPTSGTSTYTSVPLTGGTGSGATADITVINGKVAVVAVNIAGAGTGYTVGDIVSCSNSDIGGTGAGFQVPVAFTSGKGLYITVQGSRSARSSYVSGGFTSTTMVVNAVDGTITNGMAINGIGFNGSQTVTNVGTPDSQGNYTLTISGKATAQPSGTIVLGQSSGLDIRKPQVPCAYYVQGNRYQVDDILTWDPTTATAVLVLDVSTPYNIQSFYDNAKSSRDTQYTTKAVMYDLVIGSNYQSVAAGRQFQNKSDALVTGSLKTQCLAGLNYAAGLTTDYTSDAATQTAILNNFSIVTTILDQGTASAPAITYPTLSSTVAGSVYAKNILQANRAFLQQEGTSWLNSQPIINGIVSLVKNIPNYDSVVYQTNIGYLVDALCYDIMYGGTSQTYDFVQSFYRPVNLTATDIDGSGNIAVSTTTYLAVNAPINFSGTSFGGISNSTQYYITSIGSSTIQISTTVSGVTYTPPSAATGSMTATAEITQYPGQEIYIQAMLSHLNTVMQQVIVNTPVVKSSGNNLSQNTSLTTATGTEVTTLSGLMTKIDGSILGLFSGFTGGRVDTTASSGNSTYDAAKVAVFAAVSTIGSSTTSFINRGANLNINIEMGGNKSMLANDFAMINDLGYAIFCTNSGLSEQVSTFSYYCHTHYWANNGGQIRSVAGSNAHGNYGLRASGSDVTELPDQVFLANNMTQNAQIYKQGKYLNTGLSTTLSSSESLKFYIINYEYIPANISEVEIDHTLDGGLVARYLIGTVAHTTVQINGQNVLELSISTAGTGSTSTTGLAHSLYDGQMVIIRTLQNIKFTGITNVKPVRPSTAVQFQNDLNTVYRVLSYGLAESTGENLQLTPGVSILNTASSYNYFTSTTDTSNLSQLDPQYGNVFYLTGIIGNGVSVTATFTKQSTTPFAIVTTSATGTSGAYTITVSSLSGISVGYKVTGSDIGSNATVTAISGSVLTLSAANTNTVNTTVTITPVIKIVNCNPTTFNGTYTVIASPAPTAYSVSFTSAVTDTYASGGMVGPTSATTQGAVPGDSKIAVVPLSSSSAINFLNSGIYVFSYNGRTHRVLNYNAQNLTTTGVFSVSQSYSSGAARTITSVSVQGADGVATLSFTNSLGVKLFAIGQTITVSGLSVSGFNGSFTVTDCQITTVSYANATTGTATGGSIASYYIINVDSIPGTINVRDIVRGNGYLASQNITVVSTSLTKVNAVSSGFVVLSGLYNSSPAASGTITFGLATNSYLSIDPNSVVNIAGYGASINALTYVSKKSSNSTTTTATGSINANTIIVASSLGITTSASVTGTGIASSTTVLGISGTTITLSSNLTQTITSSSVTFIAGAAATTTFVTYDAAYDPVNIPIVDNWYYIQNQANTAFNGWHQLNGLTSTTTITVADTSKIGAGELLTAPSLTVTGISGNGTTVTLTFATQTYAPFTVGYPITVSGITFTLTGGSGSFNVTNKTVSACTTSSVSWLATTQGTYTSGGVVTYGSTQEFYIPSICIVQSVPTSTTFTVSPAAWIPSGFTVNAALASTALDVQVYYAGSGYTTTPTLTFTAYGTVSVAPIAVCTVANDGSIASVQLKSPGYGIVGGGTFTPSYGDATFTVSFSNTSTQVQTILPGSNTTQLSVVYNTDPGSYTTGSQITLTNSTITPIGTFTLSTVAITGTGGTFSCASTTLFVGQTLTLSGTAPAGGAQGSITGYTNPSTYYIITTNGSTTFTLSATRGGTAITTTAGTPTTLTYTASTTYVIGTTTYTGYAVTTTFGATTAPTAGTWYKVYGNTNPLYNGFYPVISSTTTTAILFYNYDPAVFAHYLGTTVSSLTSSTLTGSVYYVRLAMPSQSVAPTLNIYYTVTGANNTNFNGTYYAVASDTTHVTLVYASDPGSFTSGSDITVTGNTGPALGTGVYATSYLLTLSFTTQSVAPTVGNYFTISGNANASINGTWLCIGSTVTSIQLNLGTSNPGAYGGSTTTVTPVAWITGGSATYMNVEATSATSNSLGISRSFSTSTSAALKIGYPASAAAQITQQISTCRASGHDFLAIGTGGYVTTNYPYQIYGNPAIGPFQEKEVREEGVGRVFYVTTDQNGIFRVGKFFSVDQGTGTVTFSASIALSNLDGLGFKRGVVVSEFSTDSTFTDNATDQVPTQSAVRAYIDNRLGITHGGSITPVTSVIGPGFLPLDGSLSMKSALNMNGQAVTGLPLSPSNTTDAVSKYYVDKLTGLINAISKQVDASITSPIDGNSLIWDSSITKTISVSSATGNGSTVTLTFIEQTNIPFTPGQTIVVTGINPIGFNTAGSVITFVTSTSVTYANATIASYVSGGTITASGVWRNIALPTGDINLTYASGVITTTIQSQKIFNTMIANNAQIAQSKLALQAADTFASAPGSLTQSLLGLSRFNSAVFTSTFGWIDLKTSTSTSDGVALTKIRQIGDDAFLGNKSGATGNVTTYSSGQIVSFGDGIKNANFSSGSSIPIGAMIVNYNASLGTGSNSYSIISVSQTGGANSIIRADSGGSIVANTSYKIGTYTIVDLTSSTATNLYTPNGVAAISVANTTSGPVVAASTTTSVTGSATVSNGITVTAGGFTVSAGGANITGTTGITGNTTINGTLSISGSNTLSVGGNTTVTGTLTTTTVTTGSASTAGTLTGQWTMAASSQLDLATNNVKLLTRQIDAGSNSTTGTISGYWSLAGSSRLTATYADLAEYYEGDADYEPGTVLVFGGDKEVTTTVAMNDTRLAGVVTTNPAYVMNQEQTGIKVCLALAGRVPCKVIGRVKKGDMLTTSATPGYAVKALSPTLGAIIGKAIEDKDYGEAGVIQVAVGRM